MSLASITAQDPVAGFCIGRTLPLEGGLVDLPADPGGLTAFGISLRFALQEIKADPSTARYLDWDHDGHVDAADIRGLTKDAAADIYHELIWKPGWYARLGPQMVCWKAFDVAVNTGPRRSAVTLQKALGNLGATLEADGQVGPATLAAVSASCAKDQGAALLDQIRKVQAAYYERLCVLEPDLVTFKKGWLARAAL